MTGFSSFPGGLGASGSADNLAPVQATGPGEEVFNETAMAQIRSAFPILSRSVRGGAPLIYLDTAATSQRVIAGLLAQRDFAFSHNAAVHRGTHALAEEATDMYERARQAVGQFFGAGSEEVVFSAGTTASVNLLAWSLERSDRLGPGDRIVVTQAEHHSNLVPWQQLALATGAELAWLPVRADGRLDLTDLPTVITDQTKVVAFAHASNVSGAVTHVPALVAAAQAVGAWTVLDAAQTAPHQPLDFAGLGVDFAVVSSHKMYGPTGIGALLGRAERLAELPPGPTGGSMVEIVTMTETTFMPPPARFEPGTPPITQAVGWAAALEWLNGVGLDRVAAHEAGLTEQLLTGAMAIPGVRVLGPTDLANRLGVVSLAIEGVHPHDAGQYIDSTGVAVRVGHHCAQPIHRALGVSASTRASLGVYNTRTEVDQFLGALAQVRPYFGAA